MSYLRSKERAYPAESTSEFFGFEGDEQGAENNEENAGEFLPGETLTEKEDSEDEEEDKGEAVDGIDRGRVAASFERGKPPEP